MGERSSWAVSETRERCCCWAEVSRESMSLSVSASDRTSSRAPGTGRSGGPRVPVTRAAPRRMRSIGRRVEPTASHIAPVNTMNSTGVPKTSACPTTCRLSAAELYGTAAITSSPPAARATATRSSDGMSNGAPCTSTAECPLASASAWAGGTSGTSRSASAETLTICPDGASTWMVTVPAATGTGSGSRSALMSAATSVAPDRAVSSTDRVGDSRSVLSSSRSPATSATSRPRATMSVTRARRPRRRHHRTSTGPRPCPSHHGPRRRASPVQDRERGSATIGRQQVSRPADRLDGRAPVRDVDLSPQVPDVHLDDVEVGDLVRVIPDVREQLGLGHDLTAPPHQVLEQGELPGRELHRRRAALHRARSGVELEVPGPQYGWPRPPPPPQQRPQPRRQHDVGKRLDQVVVRADVEPVGQVVLAVLGRQEEQRHPVLPGPQLHADGVAGHAGQHDVEDDAVVSALTGHMQPGDPVKGQVHGEPRRLEAALHGGG